MAFTEYSTSEFDRKVLERMRLKRFESVIADSKWFKIRVKNDTLVMDALAPIWVDAAITNSNYLSELVAIIFGLSKISICYANELIAHYTKSNISNEAGEFDMVATLMEQTTIEQSLDQTPVNNDVRNTDYVSLDQLRAMATEIGNGEEFIDWMEANGITLPTRFFNGVPRYQSKAIIKAAGDWNQTKIAHVLSRHFGGASPSPASAAANSQENGMTNSGSSTSSSKEPLKMLRTPQGFKIATGRDKYKKTIQTLAESVNEGRWSEYQHHLTTQTEMGVNFLKRMAKQFGGNANEAYTQLLDAVMSMQEPTVAA